MRLSSQILNNGLSACLKGEGEGGASDINVSLSQKHFSLNNITVFRNFRDKDKYKILK